MASAYRTISMAEGGAWTKLLDGNGQITVVTPPDIGETLRFNALGRDDGSLVWERGGGAVVNNLDRPLFVNAPAGVVLAVDDWEA